MAVWEFFCSFDNFSSSWEMHREGTWELKSFQIRNLRAEIAVLKCIINALRCQATPPERWGERAKRPDANELLRVPSLKCRDTRSDAGMSLLRCPPHRHMGPSAIPCPRGNRRFLLCSTLLSLSLLPPEIHSLGSLGDFFLFFSQMLLLSQMWKYLICSYCLIYKCFVLSLLLLFLDYACVPPPFCPG